MMTGLISILVALFAVLGGIFRHVDHENDI